MNSQLLRLIGAQIFLHATLAGSRMAAPLLALREGYQRNRTDVALVTVVVLLILVQLLQMLGDRLVAHYTRK